MIGPNARTRALPGYPLAKIPSIKRRLMEAGVDVIDLGAGDSDGAPPVGTRDALVAAMDKDLLHK